MPEFGDGGTVSYDDCVVVVVDGYGGFVEGGDASGVAKLSNGDERVLEIGDDVS